MAENRYSFLDIIHLADSISISTEQQILLAPSVNTALPLFIGDTQIGLVRKSIIPHLAKHTDVFHVEERAIRINPALSIPTERTDAVENVLKQLKEIPTADFTCLKGWRNERYDVHGKAGEGVLMELERAAAGILGVRTYGCHMNGYVRDSKTGAVKMWVARRSKTKQTYPNILDNLVGGGLAAGVNPHTNIVKECWEEAGLEKDAVEKNIKNVGAVTFFLDCKERGWVPATEYVYDLELDESFQPKPVDGEVQGFYLWDLQEVFFCTLRFTLSKPHDILICVCGS